MRKAKETRASFRRKAEAPVPMSAKRLADAVEKARTGKQRVALKRRGKTFAAVVSAEDLATLERLDDLGDAQAYRSALAEWERDGKRTAPLDEIVRRMGLRI